MTSRQKALKRIVKDLTAVGGVKTKEIMVKVKSFLLALCAVLFWNEVNGHGMLLDPVGRASRWRYDSTAPVNYDDNALYCGGYWNHWGVNNGNCGFCGDDYSLPRPRPHELGGKFGSGVIVKSYQPGSIIPVGAKITASHMGYFYFELCNLDVSQGESESCFRRLKFGNGNDRYPVVQSTYYETTVQLPSNVVCNHCVLRWTYVAANNWGICDDGSGALGCGPQETFKSCSDIRINIGKAAAINYVKDDIAGGVST